MTDDPIQRSGRVNRRKFLTGVGAGVTAGLAGCSEGEPEQTGTPDDDTPTATEEPTETQAPDSIPRGGMPIQAIDTVPETTNPLTYSDAYSAEILFKVYDFGTAIHPEDQSFQPWSFRDWELDVDNIGSSDPTIVAELRDDMTFNDGEAVTAEDYKFTVDYIKDQEPTGSISASIYSAVEEVGVDSPDGTTVNIYLSRKDNRWFTGILGSIILPQHIWKDVADHSQYEPRNEEGLIGSGPMVLTDYNWENWYEFEFRPKEEVPWPSADYVDWIHDDAPFLDGVRLEVFGSENAMEQALLNGDVDAVYGGTSVERAVEATNRDFLEVKKSPEAGYSHHSFNLRRVPLDCPAFRQLLVMLKDGEWLVEDLFKGIGAEDGNYASIAAFQEWRPPAPTEIDEYEGISVPDLQFPGEGRGNFELTQAAIDEARNFLVNHDRAKHDYTIEEAASGSSAAPDGMEIFVNGQPLTEAHTDNDGNGGQGALEFSYNPPQEDLQESQIAQRWVGALKTLGIPVETQIQSFNSQIPKVYAQEDFDIFAMGWALGVNQTHFVQLYSSEGADVDSTEDPQMFNPMGYTGADDLIFEDRDTMMPEDRQPLVKKVLAQMWSDAPTMITYYSNLTEPVNTRYTGYIETVGGIIEGGWLNVRKSE